MFGVLSKINPWTILRDHFKTFGNADGHGRWKDVVLFYAIPLAAAFVVSGTGCGFNTERASDRSVTVLSIFIPLAFSVLVELASAIGKKRIRENPKLELLARHLYWNVSYGIFAAIVALCAIFSIDFIGIGKGKIFVGAFVAVFLHFLLTVLMVCKRFAKLMDSELFR